MTAHLSATVSRTDLLAALRWTGQAVPARPVMTVLLGVKLEADRGSLCLTTFDYTSSASALVPAPGATGSALVPARALLDIVRTLPKQADLELRADTLTLHLTGAGSTFRLPLLPLADYPAVPAVAEPAVTSFDDAGFARLAAVTVAAGRDDTLPVLTGVLLDPGTDGQLVAAATDRYRLAVQELGAGVLPHGWESALLPARALRAAGHAFAREKRVTLELGELFGERLVTYRAGLRSLTCRLLEGHFPKYRGLIPTEFTGQAVAKRAELLTAVARAAVAAPRMAPVRLQLEAAELLVTGGDGQRADSAFASTTVTAKFTGDPTRTALNPAYVTDGLAALAGDDVQLSLTAPQRPVVFTSPDSPGLTYLLMPVRVDDLESSS